MGMGRVIWVREPERPSSRSIGLSSALVAGASTGAVFFGLSLLYNRSDRRITIPSFLEPVQLRAYARKVQTTVTKSIRVCWEETPTWIWPLMLLTTQSSRTHVVLGVLVMAWFGAPDSSEKDEPPSRSTPLVPPPVHPRRTVSESVNTARPPLSRPPSSGAPAVASNNDRCVEMLLHNVSHTDLVLGIDWPGCDKDYYCLARPRFSCFDMYSRKVLDHARLEDWSLVNFERYQRSADSPRFSILDKPTAGSTTPTGMHVAKAQDAEELLTASRNDLRVPGRDQEAVNECHEQMRISHVFFPLLATLLPRWKESMMDKQYNGPVKRVLILITGVGTPRNWTHSMTGNSTEACGLLMQRFLKRIDPSLTVILQHSSSDCNIFRYDENLVFCQSKLLPTVHAFRDAHATGQPYPDEDNSVHSIQGEFNVDWRKTFAITLSYADGSPGRTHAIQACLRPYRPTFFHFWQLKTFWHESKIVDDDLEVHSFQAMESIPAIDAEQCTDPNQAAVVTEMKQFYREIVDTLKNGSHDMDRFWLRKTHKPVLAVLLVQRDGCEPVLYRGTNMEVSMPTGSLCAERNVIGTALAANPGLRRQDLKLIAVLAVPWNPKSKKSLPLMPTAPPDATAPSLQLQHVSSVSSMDRLIGTAASSLEDSASWLDPRQLRSRQGSLGSEFDRPDLRHRPLEPPFEAPPDVDWILPPKATSTPAASAPSSPPTADTSFVMEPTSEPSSSNNPIRRVSLVNHAQHRRKRTAVLVSAGDLNPLSPCGACYEWLKKISESNPYFTILTFTDAECHGMYCTPCHET